ncbi:SMC5-SMC6 complex localization factor protein 2 [Gymnogyps californianus]|uniref:SMC5-SMC6 complex localization factor protein 2 n=1 Tax=Gymnogyps californianus TaxID=33616 RepID=UPI0021C6BD35|nr:SMC5-SMC6 complex localization factor protein 2 [Gymnogyps californianus]
MTRPLGVGVPSSSPSVTRSRRHFTLAVAARETAQDFRNQTITEFFKPVLNQDLGHKDRTVLCSPDRGNVKDAGIGLSVLCAERFEKKISSPKKVRRKKMPDQTPNTSPVLDAFRRGIREKKDSVNILENGRACKALGSLYPKVVIQKLLVTAGSRSCLLAKTDKTVKSEQGRNEKCLGVTRTPLSCGNSWEEKTDRMDLEDTSSDSDKWLSSSEADTQKACARNNGTVNNTSLCQNPGLPMKLPCTPTDSEFRLSLEALCRDRKRKKHRMKQSKPHTVKPFSGTSVSYQGNGCPLQKIPHSGSRETASDNPSQPKPKQVSKHEASSPNAPRKSSEMAAGMCKSQSVPSCCLSSKMCSGRSKQIDFTGKRKRAAMSVDADSSNQSEVSSLNDPAFSRSSAKCKNRKSDFVKNILLKSTCGDVLQLMEAAALPRHDPALPEEYLNSSNENEKDSYSSVGLSSSYSAHSPGKNNHISVVDTKENQLQVANSCFFLEKSLPFSQEKSTVLPSLHDLTQTKGVKPHLQNAGLSQVLDANKEEDGKRPEICAHNKAYSIQSSNSFSKTEDKTSENASDSCSVEGSGKLALSEEAGKSVTCSLSFKEGCMDSGHMSSQLTEELKVESACTDESKLNGKSKSGFDSEDESLECNLDDDDDEEEVFMPLQEILSSSPKPQAGTLEESCLDSFSQVTMTPLLKLHLSKPPVVSQVSYVNSLEHLLKEKEESKRVDELEKRLQEDIQGRETDSSNGEDDENASGDEDLSEEHRAFIKRFSVVAHAIPDYHPGEDIFDLSTSGKIFNQHNLDLRNFHFIPQNPIEKLLLSSGVTQQLSLAINGFLSSAYSCILCPIPILKWLFQMMSVHPDYCVSTQILDRLMEITLKSASISDEQSKPWIPSLADVSAVFVNMGVAFRSLFPLQHLQPNFNECDILSQMQETVSKQQPRGDLTSASPAFSSLPENNLINVIKFLGFCTTIIQGAYTDQEILLLLLLLFKISLEKQLKQIPLMDFQCLFINLLISIKDWDTKMPELCLAVSELSSHHHNLLWLVQLVPSWIIRGREVRRRLSLVLISKLLNKKHKEIPDDSDKQMSLLHQFLVYMKPSNLLKKMREGLEQQNADGDHLHTELEQEAYYLIYILLHLVSEASFFDVVNSNQRQHLLKLCGALDKHIKCDIREDARLFYRTKVKDLVARIYGKWQDMIQTTRPTQGKLHDFWEPDS